MLAEPFAPPLDALADLSEVIDSLQAEDLHFQAGSGLGVRVEAARQRHPGMLRQVPVHLRHCVDPDGALKDANEAHQRRAVWLSETMDGVFVLNGTLDAEGGAILRAALAAVEGKPVAGD